jgi:glycerate kinase
MPTVVVASDKFKGSVTAAQVADSVGEGVRRARPDAHVRSVPIADGGDGTLAAAVAAGLEHVPVGASGPTGQPIATGYARRGDLAVVEMADVAGLVRLPGGIPAPLTASSRGVGEVVGAAVAAGCRRIVLGIGGSASTDGGAGLLAGLGARLLDADGQPVPDGGGALTGVATLDLAALGERMAGVHVVGRLRRGQPAHGAEGAAAGPGSRLGEAGD